MEIEPIAIIPEELKKFSSADSPKNFICYSNLHPKSRLICTADGKNPRNLTNHPALDAYPIWSPDGGNIAFESFRDGNCEIYVMDADGKNPRNLTNHPAEDYYPSWFDPSFGRPVYFAGELRAIWGRLKKNRE